MTDPAYTRAVTAAANVLAAAGWRPPAPDDLTERLKATSDACNRLANQLYLIRLAAAEDADPARVMAALAALDPMDGGTPDSHAWQEYNAHGNTCHHPGCRLTEEEHAASTPPHPPAEMVWLGDLSGYFLSAERGEVVLNHRCGWEVRCVGTIPFLANLIVGPVEAHRDAGCNPHEG